MTVYFLEQGSVTQDGLCFRLAKMNWYKIIRFQPALLQKPVNSDNHLHRRLSNKDKYQVYLLAALND